MKYRKLYKNKYIKLLIPVLCLSLLSACATSKVQGYQQFAAAGDALTKAVRTMTGEASSLAVDSDSQALILLRNQLQGADKQQGKEVLITTHSKSLENYFNSLALMDQHTRMLNEYYKYIAIIGSESQSDGFVEGLDWVNYSGH